MPAPEPDKGHFSDSPAHQLHGHLPKRRDRTKHHASTTGVKTSGDKTQEEQQQGTRPDRKTDTVENSPGLRRLSTSNSVHVRCRNRNFDDPVERSPSAGESARHSSELRTRVPAPERPVQPGFTSRHRPWNRNQQQDFREYRPGRLRQERQPSQPAPPVSHAFGTASQWLTIGIGQGPWCTVF